jgi:hypothetical protein
MGVWTARRLLINCFYSDRVFLDSLRKVWKETEEMASLLSIF